MHHKKNNLVKRGECQFPTDKGMVSVTPDAHNAGWAMSPDQPCKPGMYCPYACPPGQLMAQWDPKATSYSYPESMNGGLYCNDDGEIEIPFPDKPMCYDGTGAYKVKNLSGASVAICQTVLPGNEAMLIPTVVDSTATLAVPDTSYWCKTAAHFYINPPGVSATDGCIWGSKDKPHGNWTPYVAGANELNSGETFVKIGWNPIYIEPDVPFRTERPDYGIRIECDGKCGGLPCEIDPAIHDVNEVSQMKGAGAGGANFCVVSVPKGSSANLVIFKVGGGSGDSGKDSGDEEDDEGKEDEDVHDDDHEKEDDQKEIKTPKPTAPLELFAKPKTTTTEEEETTPAPTPTPTSTKKSTTKQSTTKESTTKDAQSTKYSPPKMTRPPKLFDDDTPIDTQGDTTSENQAMQTDISSYKGPAQKGGILVGENVPGQASKDQPTSKSGAVTAQVSGFLLAAVAGVAALAL
ncbi:hypothetical protein EV426DRAFT_536422 [Tirmania nivea]|nr:hypothetical protein EV426DRAFT_536422 [Tirmania nivea]